MMNNELSDKIQYLYEELMTFLNIYVDDKDIEKAIKCLDNLVTELLKKGGD